jgi:electron transfer flavoprotein alpha subunit
MTSLIIAEHDNATLDRVIAHVASAAKQLGGEIHVLVAGSGCRDVAGQAAQLDGVTKVWLAESARHPSPEQVAKLVTERLSGYSHYLAAATTSGKSLMPRVAALFDVAQISDIVKIESDDTFVRSIYAGSVLVTVSTIDAIRVITVRATAFEAVAAQVEGTAPIEDIEMPDCSSKSRLISRELSRSDRPDLASAKVVVSGGRGLGNAGNFRKLLEPLADCLGGALGASRAAVDSGFVTNDLQVGQTGKIVAPRLYIAVGLSGAIQHVAGMKDSKLIVAINKDAEAPIFQLADYGLVADLFEAVPALTAALASRHCHGIDGAAHA